MKETGIKDRPPYELDRRNLVVGSDRQKEDRFGDARQTTGGKMVFVKEKGTWGRDCPDLMTGSLLMMLQLASGLDRIPSRAAFS